MGTSSGSSREREPGTASSAQPGVEFSASRRVRSLRASQIRGNMRLAEEVGAINLAQGRPDFPTAPEVKRAAMEAIQNDHNQYSVTWGVPALREAVASMLKARFGVAFDPEREVTITCGVTEGIVAALLATLDPGDQALIIEPAHENYVPAVRFAGGEPIFLSLAAPYRLDRETLERAVTPRTRVLIVNTPHNPTGRVLDAEETRAIAEVVDRHGLYLITDEIYDHLTYDGRPHLAPVAQPRIAHRTISCGGISKIYAVTGWRLGYLAAPPAISEAIRTVHDYLTICAPTPLQYGALAALSLPPGYYEDLRADFTERRRTMLEILRKTGFDPFEPEGAYYVMSDFGQWGFEDGADAFTRMLIERAGVAGVAGTAFYYARPELGRRLIRFSFAKTLDTLREVGDRLAKAFAQR